MSAVAAPSRHAHATVASMCRYVPARRYCAALIAKTKNKNRALTWNVTRRKLLRRPVIAYPLFLRVGYLLFFAIARNQVDTKRNVSQFPYVPRFQCFWSRNCSQIFFLIKIIFMDTRLILLYRNRYYLLFVKNTFVPNAYCSFIW